MPAFSHKMVTIQKTQKTPHTRFIQCQHKISFHSHKTSQTPGVRELWLEKHNPERTARDMENSSLCQPWTWQPPTGTIPGQPREVAPRVTKALPSPSGGRIEVPMQTQICYPGSVINEIYSLASTEL